MGRKRTATKPDAFTMFCYATVYHDAAAALDHVSMNYTLPSCILEVLSIEVFLKCLKRVRGRRPLKIHDVKQLFEDLSIADRRGITRHFNATTKISIDGKNLTIDDALASASNYFMTVRYGYEAKHIWGNLGFAGIAGGARELILKKHPDWAKRYLDRRVL